MRFLFLPRFLWALLLIANCAAPASQPVVVAPPPALDAHEQALQQTHVAFSAKQRLTYDGPSGRKESDGLFMVQPGKAYRLRALGPLSITLFDVQARCGRFKLDGRDQHSSGTLTDAAKIVPFFPVEAMFWLTAPLSDGKWDGDQFVARNGVRARLDQKQKSFVQYADQSGVRITVRAFTEVRPGFFLPRSLVVDLGQRGKMYIENEDISLDVPDETAMAGEVKCGES